MPPPAPTTAQPAIDVKGLAKSFDEVEAVRGVEFEAMLGIAIWEFSATE